MKKVKRLFRKLIFESKVFLMATVFNIIMAVIATAVLVLKLATDAIARNGWTRFASATMALGFVCACVGEFLAGINVALLILSFLGFMLSYTAFVFSFPRRNA